MKIHHVSYAVAKHIADAMGKYPSIIEESGAETKPSRTVVVKVLKEGAEHFAVVKGVRIYENEGILVGDIDVTLTSLTSEATLDLGGESPPEE